MSEEKKGITIEQINEFIKKELDKPRPEATYTIYTINPAAIKIYEDALREIYDKNNMNNDNPTTK